MLYLVAFISKEDPSDVIYRFINACNYYDLISTDEFTSFMKTDNYTWSSIPITDQVKDKILF